MTHEDPLVRLLRSADGARAEPAPQADLVERAYVGARRKDAQAKILRRTALGAGAVAALLLATVAYRGQVADREVAEGPVAVDDSAEIAQLRAEAEALGAEADSLERTLSMARDEVARQELLDESRRQTAIAVASEVTPSGSDRAASIALCEGDYYRNTAGDADAAVAAYQRVVNRFPDSPLAHVARERLARIEMN